MTGASPKGRGALEVILFEETRFRGSLMFTSAEVTVGSAPGAMIRLDDSALSPCHAVLRFDGETCEVENFDPVQGTLLNGVAVERQEVTGTDELRVGRFHLRINVHRADATPAPVSVRPPARPLSPPAKSAGASAKVLSLPIPPTPPAPPAQPAPKAPPPPWPRPTQPRSPLPPPPPPPHEAKPSRPRTPPAPAATTATRPVASPPPPPAVTVNPARAGHSATLPPPSSTAALAALPTPADPPPKPGAVAVPAAQPATAQARPPLTSVPATSPNRPARTSTQPIASRYAGSRAEPVALDEFEASTVRSPSPLGSGSRVGSDDDDDDALFEPSFSLFERLRASGAESHPASAVEVVRFRQGCIWKLHYPRRGEKLRLHGMHTPIGRRSRSGGFVFARAALPETIAVSERGEPIDDGSWRQTSDKRGRISLTPGTQVMFPLPSGEGVLVHLVPAAGPLPKTTWRPRSSKLLLALAGASIAVHLVVFIVLGLASLVRRDYIVDSKEGRFARIALKEIELEPPAPPPKPEKEKKKAKPEPSQVATAEPAHRLIHLPRTRAPSPPQAQSAATAQKLLSALGNMSSGPKPMSATAMSNLSAVGPVHGGGFKVSGAIGKLPGDSLRLAAAGSGIGHLETKSANDVAKNLGRVLGHGPTGQVRAQVTSKPNTMKVEGHLDRGEIQRVINSHIHELQGCYERQLVMSPSLAGKVTFEWVIGTSGSVTTVKIKASTLSSNEATSCMQAAIRRWQFPAPSGGQVTVIYPIALANSGT